MTLSIIVATSENNVIGFHGDMPWEKMSADLKLFKQKTLHKWCIIGRKSYNALGNKVLPGRKFIVVTRDEKFISTDSVVMHTIKDAIHAPQLAHEDEVMVLGGGEIYVQALPYSNRIYLTRIHATFHGDAFFPELSADWKLIHEENYEADEKNPHPYSFQIYEK